ncbi:uncharacterized protein CLUP02_18373 [Colletotrichum lupini]|uniref:Uncharacterized protein n=1 Tax=Colletotrichum lupini TaxID=145971 RepID=A0A9Q8SGV6_9PEZI|nr:uncharacterized protein CLUP02_18373 [Colletotrichum lupini]UQC76858.1 hypothetical protein CLUP02_18373 [Colletotrichum lupini]
MVRIVMEDSSAWTSEHEYSLLYHNFLHKKPLSSTDVNQLKCTNVNQVTVISRGLENERKDGPPSGMAVRQEDQACCQSGQSKSDYMVPESSHCKEGLFGEAWKGVVDGIVKVQVRVGLPSYSSLDRGRKRGLGRWLSRCKWPSRLPYMRSLHPTKELWALSTSFDLSYHIRSRIPLLDFVTDESVCPADVYINKILLSLTIPLTPAIRGGPWASSSSGGKRGTASKVHQGGKGKTVPYTECGHRIATRLPFTFALEDFSAWIDQQENPLLYPSPLHEEPVASNGASIDTSSRTPTPSRENDRVLKPDVISHQRRLVNTTAMFRRRGLEAERRRSGHAAVLHEDKVSIVGEMKDHENRLGLFKPARIPFRT